eukprot:CAMPEP_0177393572 /NCGR_PEP_ID=MMETSP0368-20130122/55039_1 /TAXON_ID=447022 ORGANISM="Scrippsiella hangoei-like, Strain SHHI-4" /NCGR_SAMPLE_ID=MMETSP0368 /ASSEMBLY_ACC=CAM_ASM_000363 /LENGTH=225 /DNA_ID=CAMNT_0018859797 /DNA_START=73 /DNA_END=747 /DNA_ORIENTATION=-
MAAELALLMANLAQLHRGAVVLDPFAGSAGILLAAAAHCGAFCVGAELCGRVLAGDGVGRDIAANFLQLGLPSPELVRMDASRSAWRPGMGVDAIVCDPPYGVREQGPDSAIAWQGMPPALLRLAAMALRPGGRLVAWVAKREGQMDGAGAGLPEELELVLSEDLEVSQRVAHAAKRKARQLGVPGAAGPEPGDEGEAQTEGKELGGGGRWCRALVVLQRRGGSG